MPNYFRLTLVVLIGSWLSACVPKTNLPAAPAVPYTGPVIVEITPIASPTTDTTPTYIFNSNTNGTIIFGGDCVSRTTSARGGNNPITFNALAAGVHSNCTIQVKDFSNNYSAVLNVAAFTVVDTTPPTVISTSPLASASGVPANATITATFSEAMDAATISATTFTVNNGVTGTVSYLGNTATFTPSGNLASTTLYTATISGTVKDAAGNAMVTDKTWTFTSQGWVSKASIPATSYSLGGAFVGGKFYAISGFATTRLAIYDPLANSWSAGAVLPSSLLQSFGTAVLNGYIYVVGGDTGGGGDRNTLFRYDPALDTWTTLAPMPLGARYNLAVAAINGKIYVAGGYNIGTSSYLNRLEVYDPVADSWATKAAMPTARAVYLAGAINGKFYVAGGSNSGGVLNILEIYDPVTDLWTAGTPMPFAGNFDGTVLGGKLFAIGGGASPYNRVFAYNATLDSWSSSFDVMPTGRWAMGVGADEVNNKIFVVGGWNGAYVSALEVFTPPLP